VPATFAAKGALVFVMACEMGLERIFSKRVGSAYWSGNCRNRTKVKNPGFTRLALLEKCGVNSSPAEKHQLSHRAKPQRERLFFAMAAGADTTSADVLGRANSGAFRRQVRCTGRSAFRSRHAQLPFAGAIHATLTRPCKVD
jgi:hypothetical protein